MYETHSSVLTSRIRLTMGIIKLTHSVKMVILIFTIEKNTALHFSETPHNKESVLEECHNTMAVIHISNKFPIILHSKHDKQVDT